MALDVSTNSSERTEYTEAEADTSFQEGSTAFVVCSRYDHMQQEQEQDAVSGSIWAGLPLTVFVGMLDNMILDFAAARCIMSSMMIMIT